MANIFEFNASLTDASTATVLTNVVGPDWSVVRNSIAYDNVSGILTETAVNIARVGGDKTIVESAATNLLTYSDDISQLGVGDAPIITSEPSVTNQYGALGTYSISVTGAQSRISESTGTLAGESIILGALVKGSGVAVNGVRVRTHTDPESNLYNIGIGGEVVHSSGANEYNIDSLANGWYYIQEKSTAPVGAAFLQFYPSQSNDSGKVYVSGLSYKIGTDFNSIILTNGTTVTREADVITNTVPAGTAPITMTTWIDGVSDGGQVVNQGDPITMLNGTTSIEINDSASSTTTVEVEWVDSTSAAATGNKIYRDDVEIADIGMGVQIYQDDTAETGTTYKYEVQAYSATDETTQEVTDVNVKTITTAS